MQEPPAPRSQAECAGRTGPALFWAEEAQAPPASPLGVPGLPGLCVHQLGPEVSMSRALGDVNPGPRRDWLPLVLLGLDSKTCSRPSSETGRKSVRPSPLLLV